MHPFPSTTTMASGTASSTSCRSRSARLSVFSMAPTATVPGADIERGSYVNETPCRRYVSDFNVPRAAHATKTSARSPRAPQPGGSDHAQSQHGPGHAIEAGNVGAKHIVAGMSVLGSSFVAVTVDVAHDLAQALLGIAKTPGATRGILLQFQR